MKGSWTVGAIVFALICGVAFPALATYDVGLSHGTDKQRPEFTFTPVNTFHISAAKNEWEPFQVFIRSDQALTNVNVTVTEFSGPGDNITDVEPYRVHYVPVPVEEISHQPPDPSNAGMWPDGLVPFVDHFDGEVRDGAPFDVDADFTQAVFVDVFVPETQVPGDYTATVTVTANGQTDWTGTVTLTVWDFVLPNSLSIDSNYNFHPHHACNWHESHGGVLDCESLKARYFEEFARHRMSLYGWRNSNPTYVWNTGTATFDIDWTSFDAYHGPYLDGTFYTDGYEYTGIRLPGAPSGRPAEVDATDWEREWWAAWADHFRDKGWIEKLWYYMPDEPQPGEYDDLANLAARLHNADPDLQPMVTEQYEEDLGDDIDIWCPDEPLFSDSLPWPPYPEVYDDLRAEGAKTWWYNCVSATVGFDYAAHMVDYESSYMRIWLWMTRRYHFQGILFWGTNYLTALNQDVWDSMYSSTFLCQGDGTLIYPGTPNRVGGTNDIPVASLRMKYLREAMEDYEYFHILDEQGDTVWVDDITRDTAPKTYQWEHDWTKLLDKRRMVAEKILGTLDETPPVAPTDLDGEADVSAVSLTWTASTDADVAGYDVWYGIYDGDEFFGGSVNAATTSADVIGLTAGREHTFWVTAFDENGNRSADSNAVVLTPLAPTDDDDLSDDDDLADGDSSTEGDSEPDDGDADHNRNGVQVVPGADDESGCGCGGM